MKTLDPGLAEHIAGGVTTLCRCWRLDRKDGTVMGFTDHDGDLAFDGVTYAAASGFTATSIEDQLGLAVSNLDAEGALLSDALTEDDLYAGRWDGATITIWLVVFSRVRLGLNPEMNALATLFILVVTIGVVIGNHFMQRAERRRIAQAV